MAALLPECRARRDTPRRSRLRSRAASSNVGPADAAGAGLNNAVNAYQALLSMVGVAGGAVSLTCCPLSMLRAAAGGTGPGTVGLEAFRARVRASALGGRLVLPLYQGRLSLIETN